VRPDPLPPRPARLPAAAVLASAVLLLIPMVALAVVPLYAKDGPRLWGFPFFFWYQFLWVFLASGFTYLAYVVVTRARRNGARR
jgi:hypothetical protein